MPYDQHKLNQLSAVSKCPMSLLIHCLNRSPSRVERQLKTVSDMETIRVIAKNSGMEPYSAPARIAACRRWLELEPEHATATIILNSLIQEIEVATQAARQANSIAAAMAAYDNAPEGSSAEKIAIERALELV